VSVVLVRLKDILCCGIYVTPRQDTVATFGRRTNSLHARKRRPYLILHVALPRMPSTVSSKDKLGIALEQWTQGSIIALVLLPFSLGLVGKASQQSTATQQTCLFGKLLSKLFPPNQS
jgi:hypothetical protein